MEFRPPDLSEEIGRPADYKHRRPAEIPDLAGKYDGLELETLLSSLIPKNCEVGAGDHGINDLGLRRLES